MLGKKDKLAQNSLNTGSTNNYKKISHHNRGSALSYPPLLVTFASLERHLQDFFSESVPIQAVDRHGRLFVVRHGNKTEAFALAGVEISDHFHIDDGTKRPKKLPQDGFIGILTQIINEDAPTIGRVPRDAAAAAAAASHVINTHWRKPTTRKYDENISVVITVVLNCDKEWKNKFNTVK